VTTNTEEIRPKVTLMNKCANIPLRKMFMCHFGIYLHKFIKNKPHYIFSYLLKLVAWQYYVILEYGNQIFYGFDFYCSNCIKFLHVRYLIRSVQIVLNKALKTVQPKSNRLRRLPNWGKNDGNHKVWTPRLAEVFQSVSNRKLKRTLSIIFQQRICLLQQ
jgi:hypothetical protein